MPAKIAYLEDSEDLRVLMAALTLTKLGEECLCLSSLDDLKENEIEVLGTRVAILDINLGEGEPSGLDAFDWLKNHGFKGKIFFLTGHARSHPLVAKACASGADVWAKPTLTNQMFSTMADLIHSRGG